MKKTEKYSPGAVRGMVLLAADWLDAEGAANEWLRTYERQETRRSRGRVYNDYAIANTKAEALYNALETVCLAQRVNVLLVAATVKSAMRHPQGRLSPLWGSPAAAGTAIKAWRDAPPTQEALNREMRIAQLQLNLKKS